MRVPSHLEPRRGRPIALATAGLASTLVPLTALANTAVPVVLSFVEGGFFGAGGLRVIVLAALLPALIEWPFIKKAGVAKIPLVHATAANAISTVVGVALSDVSIRLAEWAVGPAHAVRFWLWAEIPFLVACSILLEYWYYRKAAGPVNWRWVVLANVVSIMPCGVLSLPRIVEMASS